jgi:hypothetical protein
VLGRAERKRPRVADGPWGQVPGQLRDEKHLWLSVVLEPYLASVQPEGTIKPHTASPDLGCVLLGAASRTPDDDQSMLSATTFTAQ